MTGSAHRSWSGSDVVVTGAGGFIGSRLVAQLLEAGASVRPLLHYRGGGGVGLLSQLPTEMRTALEPMAGDLRDVEWVRRNLDGVDVVFHLGAHVGIPYSYVAPRDVVEVNLGGTLNVLEALRAGSAGKLVQMSTSEVYGSARSVPIDEDHPLSAQSPYAASKIAADQLALSFHRSFGVPVAIARPFNTYGPGQTARAVIPAVISQAMGAGPVAMGALSPTRDFNFVDDTARGLLAVGSHESAIGRAFNIGSGRETSIAELVGVVASVLGRDLEVVEDPERIRPAASEVDRLVADPSALMTATGWRSEVDLRDGIERTVAWMREHPDLLDRRGYAT